MGDGQVVSSVVEDTPRQSFLVFVFINVFFYYLGRKIIRKPVFTSAKYHPTGHKWSLSKIIHCLGLLFLPLLIFFFRGETSFRVESPLVWNLEGTGPSMLGGRGEDISPRLQSRVHRRGSKRHSGPPLPRPCTCTSLSSFDTWMKFSRVSMGQ